VNKVVALTEAEIPAAGALLAASRTRERIFDSRPSG
jgi:hypothetical protein